LCGSLLTYITPIQHCQRVFNRAIIIAPFLSPPLTQKQARECGEAASNRGHSHAGVRQEVLGGAVG
jgi:hypothetical protein